MVALMGQCNNYVIHPGSNHIISFVRQLNPTKSHGKAHFTLLNIKKEVTKCHFLRL